MNAEIPSYMEEEITVGRLVRWIDREHMKAATDTPMNSDYMRELQKLGEAIDGALKLFRGK